MKPFDLEKALKGEPIITRDGRKVLEFKFFETLRSQNKLLCVIEGDVICYKIDGKVNSETISNLDLFMNPKKLYIAIKKNNFGSNSYATTNSYEDKNTLIDDLNRTNDIDNFYIKEFEIEN